MLDRLSISRGSKGDILPLSPAQLGIWFAHKLDPLSPAFNIAELLEIEGRIDTSLFEEAAYEVVAEADALRLQFLETEDGPAQLVGSVPAGSIRVVDLVDAPNASAAAEEWMRADILTPTNLAGPLFSFVLFKIADSRFYWYTRYHHLIIDGFGAGLIARRVAHRYKSRITCSEKPADPFGSLTEMLTDEINYLDSPRFNQDRRYWIDQLSGLEGSLLSHSSSTSSSRRIFNRHTFVVPQSYAKS